MGSSDDRRSDNVESCTHRFTRPTTVDDPRPFCVSCLTILTPEPSFGRRST